MDAPATATLAPDADAPESPATTSTPPRATRRRRVPRPSLFTVLTAVVATTATVGAGILASQFGPTPSPSTVTAHAATLPDESALWTGDGAGGHIPAAPFDTPAAPFLEVPADPAATPQDVALRNPVTRPFAISPLYGGILTSGFGPRWGEMHNGIDIAANMGAPIFSVTDGTVLDAGPAAGYGVWIRIRQDDGTIGIYGHMEHIFVLAGERVAAGQIIATVGSRGFSTGPHLHYEVRRTDGTPMNPLQWLASRGVFI